MAENNFLTPAWVNAGQNIGWWYTFHDQRGAQYAMANAKTTDADMETVSQGEQLNDDGTVTYFVTFHNNGSRPCFHNLNVGGLT